MQQKEASENQRDFNKNEIAIVTKFTLASLTPAFNICIKFIVTDNYFEPILYIQDFIQLYIYFEYMLCFFFFLEGGRNFHLLHLFLHMYLFTWSFIIFAEENKFTFNLTTQIQLLLVFQFVHVFLIFFTLYQFLSCFIFVIVTYRECS